MTIDLGETPALAAARMFFGNPPTEMVLTVTSEKTCGIYDYFNCGMFRIFTARLNEHGALIQALLNSFAKQPNNHPALYR
jgi:hypothetical protein